jgi:AraC-like DNA-binding protein
MSDRAVQDFQLRPILSGDMLIDERWNRFRDHCIPYWTLYINARAGASVRLRGGRTHALAPGRVHLIPAWVRFDCHTTRTVPHLWSVFDVVGIPGSLVREVFPSVRAFPLSRSLAGCAQRMREALAADPNGRATACAVTSLLYAAAAELVGGLTAAEEGRLFAANAPGNRLSPALTLIDRHLDRPVGNRALARSCGLSEHHFIRAFHREVGQTPTQYRLERRVAEAARLLAASERSIDEIAARCGFSDRFYFTRMFSRQMGLGPATYRRRGFAESSVRDRDPEPQR